MQCRSGAAGGNSEKLRPAKTFNTKIHPKLQTTTNHRDTPPPNTTMTSTIGIPIKLLNEAQVRPPRTLTVFHL